MSALIPGRPRGRPEADRRDPGRRPGRGAVGITIGIATASLLARDVAGSEEQAGPRADLPGARRRGLGVPPRPAHVRPRPPGRPRDGLPRRGRGHALAVVAGVVGSMLLLLSARPWSAPGPRPTAGRGTPPPTSPPRTGAPGPCRRSSGRPRSAPSPGRTSPGRPGAFADAVGIPVLTGPFALGAVGMLLAAIVVAVRLRPDPLLLAREAPHGRREPRRRARDRTGALGVVAAYRRRGPCAPVLGWRCRASPEATPRWSASRP